MFGRSQNISYLRSVKRIQDDNRELADRKDRWTTQKLKTLKIMASEVISFPVNLRKNKNQYNPSYGKYFPEADTKEPLNLKGFARHLSEHGKLVDYPMAVLVLQNVVNCLKEMAVQGQPVKLDGFGTFSPSIESDGRKVVNSVEGSLAVGIENLIAGCASPLYPRELEGREADQSFAEG